VNACADQRCAQNACIAARDLPRAERTFRELLDNGLLVPDELVFTVLLRAHGAQSPPGWAEISSLLGAMKHTWGIPPSQLTYNALLEACAGENDYERGCQLIDRMLSEGVQPDGYTVAAVSSRKSLRTYLKRALENAEVEEA
jgi:pentatricopeptide repeat protein